MRKTKFQTGSFYHIYNRGVDKRRIFNDKLDYERFIEIVKELNHCKPIGSLFLKRYLNKKRLEEPDTSKFEVSGSSTPLVEITAYCLLPNHYHFLIKEINENGISRYMQRLGISHTNYFNARRGRTGYLFQGKFKAVEIKTDAQLWYLSAYINGNAEIHGAAKAEGWVYSSYPDYLGRRNGKLCRKETIIREFKDAKYYREYVNEVIRNSREIKAEIKACLLEK